MKPLLKVEQAAEFLGLSKRTLDDWRGSGKGPPYIRISQRAVRYRPEDLERWVAQRAFKSTSEESVE